MPTNQQWVLKRRPEGEIQAGDLELIQSVTPDLKDGEVLVRTIYLSLDPTNRIWMSDADAYLPPVGIGEVMRGGGIGVVEQSRSEQFQPGDVVNTGLGGWQLYGVFNAGMLSSVPQLPGVPLTALMHPLGATGLTAWFGMTDICKPQSGETVVVSAAAGAVGSLAGQIAKMRGARVVGIAGGPDKCRWLTDELGFDAAIDYKSQNVGEMLDRHCPRGIDVNFENVGGEIMDQVFSRMNLNGRMALCGLISTYNAAHPPSGPSDFVRILMKRLLIKGFIIIDYLPRAPEAFAELAPAVASGKLKWKVHVEEGLENALKAVNRLFTGAHDGKLVLKVSPEP